MFIRLVERLAVRGHSNDQLPSPNRLVWWCCALGMHSILLVVSVKRLLHTKFESLEPYYQRTSWRPEWGEVFISSSFPPFPTPSSTRLSLPTNRHLLAFRSYLPLCCTAHLRSTTCRAERCQFAGRLKPPARFAPRTLLVSVRFIFLPPVSIVGHKKYSATEFHHNRRAMVSANQ